MKYSTVDHKTNHWVYFILFPKERVLSLSLYKFPTLKIRLVISIHFLLPHS